MKLKQILMACLIAGGMALSANAGTIADSDTDLIPDVFDNCPNHDNGPNTVPANNQTDLDGDGYGVRCDPDYNEDGTVGVGDFTIFFHAFIGTTPNPKCDHNQDGSVGVGDFTIFTEFFFGPGAPG